MIGDNNNYQPEDDFDNEEFDDECDEDVCPYFQLLIGGVMADKPFGIVWSEDNIKDFLKQKGYKVITRYSKEKDREYTIAIEPDSEYLPDNGEYSNIRDVFSNEVQKLLTKWLLTL